MKQQKGFTLVELMVVVVIIGILSAIAFPSYNAYVNDARRSDAKVALSKIADRQERYYLQNGTYTTSLAAINMSTTSDEGFYALTVPSADGSGFTATATAQGDAAKDSDCTSLSLSSTGAKTATGAAPAECW